MIYLLPCQHWIHIANRIPINHIIITEHRWLQAASVLSLRLQNLSSTLLCSALSCDIPVTGVHSALHRRVTYTHYPSINSRSQLPQRLVSSSECCRSQLSLLCSQTSSYMDQLRNSTATLTLVCYIIIIDLHTLTGMCTCIIVFNTYHMAGRLLSTMQKLPFHCHLINFIHTHLKTEHHVQKG